MVDYVIVGAGVVGLATAFHLKVQSPSAEVLVIERHMGPGGGDSARSVAAIRAFFTNPVNLMLANSSIEYYKHVHDRSFDLGMKLVGYLFLADKRLYELLKDGLKEAEKMGLEYRILDPGFLAETLNMNVKVEGSEESSLVDVGDIEAGVLVPRAGIIRAERVVEYYYRAAQAVGVNFSFGNEVRDLLLYPRRPLGIEGEPFPWQEARVGGVRLANGQEVHAKKKVIVAGGSWSWRLTSKIGVETFTRPKRRQVFAVKAANGLGKTLRAKHLNPHGISPFMILPRKIYMRPVPEEESFWIGMSDELGRPYEFSEDPDPRAEVDFYVKGILPVASLYFPQLQERYPHASWAGYYDLSPDKLPVIYEPYGSDLIVSCGTSGSGIMKADAIGRITAALALGEEEGELFTGERIRVDALGLKNRVSGAEKLVL
ncbi:MAG: FAD-binding oxidoreductase [Acidilobaceae archaeon]|nr:FAD-binding oxidoreductase [Acidilobaceae archaeon]MCX8166106.1 FAD-binding oxidoreductase [Acidilobaceae archaeon]MDW7974749.1 FAD-binding oxidoreductase [Sulfolobales archaeon]